MRILQKLILILVIACAASAQQTGTASTSLNVQSSVQVNPIEPRYLVQVCSLQKAQTKTCNETKNSFRCACQEDREPSNSAASQPNRSLSTSSAAATPTQSNAVSGQSNSESAQAAKKDDCPEFFPRPEAKGSDTNDGNAAPLDANALIPLLGNPDPFSLQASGDDKLLIYSKRPLGSNKGDRDHEILIAIKAQIAKLRDPRKFPSTKKRDYQVELAIPHAQALGDPSAAANSLGFSDLTVQNSGPGRVRIKASGPSCDILKSFYADFRRAIWRPQPENSVYRVFYINAPDAVGAVGGSAGVSPSQAASASPQTASTPVSATAQASAPAGANPQQSGGTTTSITVGATSPANNSQTASPASGPSPSAGKSASSPTTSAGQNSSSAPAAGNGAGGSGGSNATSPVGNDFLVFSDANPGDDTSIAERKRIVSQLDLPRPEMIINVWVAQKSSTRAEKVLDDSTQLRQVVRNFNDALQDAIERGWRALKKKITEGIPKEGGCGYFNCGFYNYIAFVEIAESSAKSDPKKEHPETDLAQNFLQYTPSAIIQQKTRLQEAICPVNAYCLGYRSLFTPLRPRLTDLLLTAIAAQEPDTVIKEAINEMEHHALEHLTAKAHVWQKTCDERDKLIYECWKWREARRKNLTDEGSGPDQCKDEIPNMQLPKGGAETSADELPGMPNFGLECFRTAAEDILRDNRRPQAINLVRAAVADFLFDYKMSQQYPHEFFAYELSQSAQSFNTALSPLIDAFNRDLANFQTALINGFSKSAGENESWNWLGAERPSFNNNGFITVRTVSGIDTKVNTTTQNFLDATQQPTVSDLLKSINASATSTKATAGTLFQNISPIQAQVIMGAINAVQSSKIQIGRGLNIDVTPRSLSGASSAEIAVTVNADESAAPTFFGGNLDTKNADISRVAQHDTTTRVRVDSIKLFEVSTLTAELDKSRTRLPIIPPFVEIPYLGSLIGWPLPRAKEYHNSVAVLSAVVVPTAADLAYGIEFTLDRLITTPSGQCSLIPETPKLPVCELKRAAAISDLHGAPIFSFHKRMVECLAMGGWGPDHKNGCETLTFGRQDDVHIEKQ